ncbi:MAG: hypothetical protein A3K75_04860 [Euryarchaeota archaeon RBG_13_61_15]|nr:MAG: hypothetical protein A3K75_04860 [Euryarchaeota archaeon RBG_13_61_15]
MMERIKFALVAAMLMTLAGLSWLLPIRYVIEGGSAAGITLALLLSAVITCLSVVYIRHEHRNAREGYPLMDERSAALRTQTGNYAFFISAAIVLSLFAFSLSGIDFPDNSEMQAGEVLFAVMIVMVCVYLGVWTLLTFKWRLD